MMYSHDIETKQKVTVQLISIHQGKKTTAYTKRK